MGAKKLYDELREEREHQISSKIDQKLKVKIRTLRTNESLKTAVLSELVDLKYEECESLLTNYSSSYDNFVDFQCRVEPYINHCLNLVKSIEIKRSFRQIASMPTIKQQELMDKVVEDFNELRLYLARIEVMHTEVVYKDILSMTILIRTIMVCTVIFTVVAGAIGIGGGGIDFLLNFLNEVSATFAGLFS